MKRICPLLLLTLVSTALGSGSARAQGNGSIDIDVTELTPVWNSIATQLCPGSNNAIRVGLTWYGAAPSRAVSLRLVLTLPGGPAPGTLLAEGTVTLRTDTRVTTFTFLHVEVPPRMRGRGAQLIVRANMDQLNAEEELSNNSRQLAIDAATDWNCKARADGKPQGG